MRIKRYLAISIVQAVMLFCMISCVKNRNFDLPESSCSLNIVANTTYADVKNIYVDNTIQIQQDLIIEGYVNSSDKDGNFFSVLHFQNKLKDATAGFQLEIDLRDSHLFYPVGSKIIIKLKGLFLGRSKGVYKLGGSFTSFGNTTVGRLPAAIIHQHLFLSCEDKSTVVPKVLKINQVQNQVSNTLVMIEDVQIINDEINLPFAVNSEETTRAIVDCDGNEITLLNSGYSDFYDETIPSENGSITGVLIKSNDEFQLIIRSLIDVNFTQDRCRSRAEVSSEYIFISELADPDNNAEARFVELYNAGTEVIFLNGWKFLRYTNNNTEISSSIDLSDFSISAESTLVFAANAEIYRSVYGKLPDFEAGKNSPADSNGDDNFQLVDPFGKIIDAFGVVGEDGSGTGHEFENGRALRRSSILKAKTIFDSEEWEIYNDSGEMGTIDEPKIAPDDFTAGIH